MPMKATWYQSLERSEDDEKISGDPSRRECLE